MAKTIYKDVLKKTKSKNSTKKPKANYKDTLKKIKQIENNRYNIGQTTTGLGKTTTGKTIENAKNMQYKSIGKVIGLDWN